MPDPSQAKWITVPGVSIYWYQRYDRLFMLIFPNYLITYLEKHHFGPMKT